MKTVTTCPASRRRTRSTAIATLLVMTMWSIAGYLAAATFGFDRATCTVAAAIAATVIFMVERIIILSPSNGMLTVARIGLAVCTASLGALVIDINVFRHEVAEQLMSNAQAKVRDSFAEQLLTKAAAAKETRKAWQELEAQAVCEADKTCGTGVGGLGQVYKAKKARADAMKAELDRRQEDIAALELQRDRALAALSAQEVVRKAGLLGRVEALAQFTADKPKAQAAWVMFFALIAIIESMVLLLKRGFGKTASDRLEEMRIANLERRARAYSRLTSW